jgi:plasmid maintenance system antidote protein VapI
VQLTKEPNRFEVSIETIRSQQHSGKAFALACDCSGLDAKQIYMELGIDKARFSHMKNANAALPADSVKRFCEIVGNTIYLEWLAFQVGCTLVMIQTEAERRLILSKQRAKKAEEDIDAPKIVIQSFRKG